MDECLLFIRSPCMNNVNERKCMELNVKEFGAQGLKFKTYVYIFSACSALMDEFNIHAFLNFSLLLQSKPS